MSQALVSIDQETRASQYKSLLKQLDPNSSLEREVLDYMYESGMRLPDHAQYLISETQSKPDFIYLQPAIAIFCDGSVHNTSEQKALDKKNRDDIRYETKFSVVELSSKENWREYLQNSLSL